MFDPKTRKFPYPEITDEHYLKVKKNRGIEFDSSYPYIDKSKSFKFKNFFFRCFLISIVFPVVRTRLGYRVKGKGNLKKHKAVIDNGIISCCNHIHMWDFLGFNSTIALRKPKVLIWAANINGSLGPAMRHVGGVPIPENDRRATMTYMRALKEYLTVDKGWLHIYAEGSMWEYYAPIRPFKKGVAFLACECDKPVLPMAFTYREPNFIRKHIFRQIACLTLNIGEPVYRNPDLARKEQVDDLTKRVHREVCELAGIDPDKNIYPPIFKDTKRVDYYTDTYGVGYKGSW